MRKVALLYEMKRIHAREMNGRAMLCKSAAASWLAGIFTMSRLRLPGRWASLASRPAETLCGHVRLSLELQELPQTLRRTADGTRQAQLRQIVSEDAVDVIQFRASHRLLRLYHLHVVGDTGVEALPLPCCRACSTTLINNLIDAFRASVTLHVVAWLMDQSPQLALQHPRRRYERSPLRHMDRIHRRQPGMR